MSSTTMAMAAILPTPSLRSKRKSAKAAGAFIAAAVKEELSAPEEEQEQQQQQRRKSPSSNSGKRSYAKANSGHVGGHGAQPVPSTAQANNALANNRATKQLKRCSSAPSSSSAANAPSPTATSAAHSHAATKKKTALSTHAVEYLKSWMMSPEHIEHPYPTEDEKSSIMEDTGIELKQLNELVREQPQEVLEAAGGGIEGEDDERG
eukprot:CAMPEP_0181102762 /NCGR_PEP_ID=MMETSP1071-20121207/14491_1 /TAXON_ID=35127 /ORGANISM="Thalassiosira sp., Strain NH16" /LENGTH=206 /DNA_ID=CAMNT_0023185763 /DNA_START=356 /DNA_END=971 /DNA_ORIENTATION=-